MDDNLTNPFPDGPDLIDPFPSPLDPDGNPEDIGDGFPDALEDILENSDPAPDFDPNADLPEPTPEPTPIYPPSPGGKCTNGWTYARKPNGQYNGKRCL